MSEHTLFDLLNDAIETPHKGVVNFSALHALLHAVLRRLDARDAPWKDARDTPWKDARDTPWRDPERGGAGELKVEPGEELQQRIASPSSSSGPAAGDQLTRIRTCEDGVFKVRAATPLNQNFSSMKRVLQSQRVLFTARLSRAKIKVLPNF